MKELPFTGERFVPTEHGRIAYEHYHRYAACLDAAAGKTVLDIACGEGFGSALLASRATKVIGVDIDAVTIRHAVKKYRKLKNATFTVGDVRAIPLDKNSVDLIVSFETIEHIKEHEQLLNEFLRVLRPDGAIIVSSPDRENYSEKPGYVNPYHVRELTHEQFVRLFRERFRFVRVYRQRLAIASFVLADEAKGPKLLQSFMAGKHGIESGSRPLRGSLYSLVFCSNSKSGFRSLGSSIHLDPEDDLFLEQERVLRWASGLYEEHEVLKGQIQTSKSAVEDAKKISADVNAAMKIATENIAELTRRNADVEAQCRELEGALSQRNAEGNRLQAELKQRNAERERLQTELSQRNAESDRLQAELKQRNAESERLQTELSQRNAESGRLRTELSQRSAENGRLQVELSQQSKESMRLQTMLLQRSAECGRLQAELSQQKVDSARLQTKLSQQTAESWRLQTVLSQRKAESERLRTELSQKSLQNERLQTGLSQKNEENERLQTELLQQSAQSKRLQTELSQQTAENRRLQTDLSQRSAESERLQLELSQQTAESLRLKTELLQQHAESQRLHTELLSRSAEIDSIRGLLSWRLTTPLRTIETKFHIISKAQSIAKLMWWTMSFQIFRRLKQQRQFARETALVKSTGLFDQDWYLKQYPDVSQSGINPFVHYIRYGAAEGRNPNLAFDTDWYIRQYPDVTQSGVNPLVHYISHGAAEGRDPNPVFDTDWYLAQNPDVAQSGVNPLSHYLNCGEAEGRAPNRFINTDWQFPEIPDPTQAGVSPPGHSIHDAGAAEPADNIFQAEVISARGPVTRDLTFPPVDRPAVSIVIPVYGKSDYTIQCLCSLENQKSKYSFEVLVIDDCSPDDTRHRLDGIKNIVVVANQINLGFIRSCNVGAAAARGEYIVFLNNDTIVLNGWLDALIDTFAMHPSAGLVGSKLIYPDGRLQEAGGIIWNDATGWNFGRLDDPAKPEYNYVREVDYCSGASIALRRSLFNQLGHLDERYVPAYYDDTDLAFAVRDSGFKVLYQPASRVVHYEGVTSGTDLSSGVKTYQLVNREKFAEKWAERLAIHGAPGENWRLIRDRFAHGRILVIDATTPTPDQDSGSLTAIIYLRTLIDLGFKVTFIPENLLQVERYTENLQQLGIECIYFPYYQTHKDYIEKYGDEFDIVTLFRVMTANKFYDIIKRNCPTAKIIFNTVDLHYLREERHAALTGSASQLKVAARTKAIEIGLMRKVDATIVLSDVELELLKRIDAKLNLVKVPSLLLGTSSGRTPFAQRKDIAFVGGYQHPPNVDAVEYFVEEIWPLLKDRLPDVHFLIVGSKMPKELSALHRYERVEPIGFVPDIGEFLNQCRLTVAPLRYGAGIKGKIAASGAYGVPVVATTVAAEGMGLQDGQHVLIADTPDAFADKIVQAYNDEALWNRLRNNNLAFVEENFSFSATKLRICELLEKLGWFVSGSIDTRPS